MQVIKRSGLSEEVSFDKITARIKKIPAKTNSIAAAPLVELLSIILPSTLIAYSVSTNVVTYKLGTVVEEVRAL